MKKSEKSALIQISALLGILVVLGGIYLLKTLPSQKKKEEKGKTVLIGKLDPQLVTNINITYSTESNRSETLLGKYSNGWQVVSPIKDKADEDTVAHMLNGIPSIASQDIFSNVDAAKLNDFGFNRPGLAFKALLQNGSAVALTCGGKSSNAEFYYVILDSISNVVYLVPIQYLQDMEKTTAELRDKEIFNIPVQNLARFEVETAKGGLYRFETISTNTGTFTMSSPKKMDTDSFAVKSKLLDFYPITISRYLEDKPKPGEENRYGLSKPLCNIRLTAKDGAQNSLSIGNQMSEGLYYAKSTGKSGVFLIEDKDLSNKLNLSITNFQSRQAK